MNSSLFYLWFATYSDGFHLSHALVKDFPTGNERVGGGGHWTRDLEFSPDGKTLYVSVGSRSNVDDNDRERRRAMIHRMAQASQFRFLPLPIANRRPADRRKA